MTTITGEHQIRLYQMATRKQALKLELQGLKRRGRSMYSIVKEQYGLRGSRQSVYTQFCELLEKEKSLG